MINTARKKQKRHSAPTPSSIRATGIGLAATALTSAATLLFFSMIIYTTPDPGSLVLAGGLAALYVSSFVGGLIAALNDRNEPMLCGLLNGVFTFVCLILLALVLPTQRVTSLGFWASAGLHLLAVPFSALGAYAANSLIRSRTQRKRRKRRTARS